MSNRRHFPWIKALQLANRLEHMETLLAALDELGRTAGWPERRVLDLSLACEELFLNIVSYGYPDGGEHMIEVYLSAAPDGTEISFVDGGIPYNPLEQGDPDRALALEDRPIGGLGIYFVKRLMDEVTYIREGDRNKLTMRKQFAPGGGGTDQQEDLVT